MQIHVKDFEMLWGKPYILWVEYNVSIIRSNNPSSVAVPQHPGWPDLENESL